MENSINQRVKKARITLGLSQDEVAEAIGKKVSAISKIESSQQNVTPDLISFYYRKGISSEWILENEGEMFKNAMPEPQKTAEPAVPYRNVENDRETGQKSIIYTDGHIPENAIPLYDIEVSAGNVNRIIEDNNNVPIIGWIKLDEIPNPNGLLGVRAKGNSMASFINSGDMLLVRRLQNRGFIPLGEAYVIITEEQSVTKYIRAGSTPETYTLRSHNYSMFEDFEVLKSDIKHLFLVVKVIKDVTY